MRHAVLLLAALAVPALAQADREATERRLSSIRDQISTVERQVQATRGREATALQALDGLQTEIALREQLVSGYRTQIDTLQGETTTLRRSIERLETEIQSARESYRRRARHAYVHGRRNGLALILSAGSVNQMLVRARYLQQFARRRRQQVERVAQKTGELRGREQEMRATLEETQRMLQQGQSERSRLAQTRRDREALVVDLRSQRGRLERELAQRQADARQLSGLVAELVAEERRRAAEEERRRQEAAAEAARQAEAARVAAIQREADEAARRAREAEALRRQPERRTPDPAAEPSAPPSEPVARAEPPRAETPPPVERPAPRPTPRTTPPPAADRPVDLTGSFRQNRGRLPWPADGTVTGRFGNRVDPVTNTTTSSPGIDIATASAAPARAVYEGTVQRVGTIPTYGTYVMITHGEFVTLYGNLSQVAVSQGQRVRAGQVVGRAGTASARRGTQLFFALYQGGTAVDPTGWLSRR